MSDNTSDYVTITTTPHQHYVEPNHKHELVLCLICDTVYCIRCGKEWKHQTVLGYYQPYVTITYAPDDYMRPQGDTIEQCNLVHTHLQP